MITLRIDNRAAFWLPVLVAMLWLQGCATTGVLGKATAFSALPGWQNDDHSAAWPALLRSCEALKRIKDANFSHICTKARELDAPDNATARQFFESWFSPRPVRAPGFGADRSKGLFTGYYAPLLHGSRSQSERFRWPLYKPPTDLVRIELSALYPELKGKRIRGKLVGNRVIPFPDRAEIDNAREHPLAGHEVIWVDDPADAFFLHIQGSGRVLLEDGTVVGVGYADQNGHPYRSIGRELIDRGEIKREDVSLQSIRAWLDANPDEVMALFATNPSYVFFRLNENGAEEPKGSLAVHLTPERSIAIDRNKVPFGLPMWIDTTLPGTSSTDAPAPWQRLMLAQDTGGAIRGEVRADVYFGSGERAEFLAGNMKQHGRIWLLEPKPAPEP